MAKRTTKGPLQNFVSPKEASERLGVTTQTLRNWARSGKISFIMLPSGRRHYNVDALMAAMSEATPFEAPEPVKAPEPAPMPVNPMMAALAQLMNDPVMAAHIRAMLQASPPPAPEQIEVPAIAPMVSGDALKSAIEALAG